MYYPEPVEYVTSSIIIDYGGIPFVLPLLVPVTATPVLVPTPTIANTITIFPTAPPTSLSYPPTLSTSVSSITQLTTSSTPTLNTTTSSSSYASGSKSPLAVSGTATPSSESKAESKAAKTGGTIAVVIGTVSFVIALVLIVIFLLRKRLRRHKKSRSLSKGKQRKQPTYTETNTETQDWREDGERALPSIPQPSHQPSRKERCKSIFSKFRRQNQPVTKERTYQEYHDELREIIWRDVEAMAPHFVDPYYRPRQSSAI